MAVPSYAPMLASPARDRALRGEWAFEPKFDGWRALVTWDGELSVRTRSGRDITGAVPELATVPTALDGRSAVLDGELVAGAGRPDDFYGIAGRVASRRPSTALTFVAFDVLFLDGASTCHVPYSERRELLVKLAVTGGRWATVPSFDDDAQDVLDACAHLGLEGVVAKRRTSIYRPGRRSQEWLKIKTSAWRTQHAPRRHEHVPAARA